ncbi:MAG: hypothetical protein HRU46_18295 [Verrucomicrobiales bacterium]|nr:hypothetical protein [Verrucomicrobiales bacterium]
MELSEWLEREGLSKYAELLAANDIDEVEILADLTDAEWEAIGIPIGARKKIRRGLSRLGYEVENTQALTPPAAPQAAQPSVENPPEPASLTPVQQPASPEVIPPQEAPQSFSEAPVQSVQPAATTVQTFNAPLHAQTPQTQATRHEPKAKTSRRATAIMVAVGIHVAIILIATTLTIFAASKDEPEIIAAIAPPAATPQQEMKKKTVQKQVKRAPSSASAAAAPMAIMMKANAEARFTTPEVTRTSTGPLGAGEGDLGSGAFGVGNGLGDAGAGGGAMFMGTKTKGRTAVIFDISKTMYSAVPLVVKEIKRVFADAQVVCVMGCQFEDDPGDGKSDLMPYQDNKVLLARVKNDPGGNASFIRLNKVMTEALFSLENCLSLSETTQMKGLQNMGLAIERLLEQPAANRPSTIFVFADFRDRINPEVMERVKKLLNRTQSKIVFYQAHDSFRSAEEHQKIKNFTEGIDGEIKIGLRQAN